MFTFLSNSFSHMFTFLSHSFSHMFTFISHSFSHMFTFLCHSFSHMFTFLSHSFSHMFTFLSHSFSHMFTFSSKTNSTIKCYWDVTVFPPSFLSSCCYLFSQIIYQSTTHGWSQLLCLKRSLKQCWAGSSAWKQKNNTLRTKTTET